MSYDLRNVCTDDDAELCFFFSSRRRHTRYWRDWSSDVCSSDLNATSLQLTTGMTLEVWVFPTGSLAGWRAVLDKNVDGYYLMASSDPNNRPAVGGTWTGGNQNTAAPTALALNAWTHLAATFDGATVRRYR